MNFEQKLEPFI